MAKSTDDLTLCTSENTGGGVERVVGELRLGVLGLGGPNARSEGQEARLKFESLWLATR